MAFDQSTRGRLQKLVNICRSLLSDEFSIQLQQTYGLDPKTGEVTSMARLKHLDDRQRHTAEILRQTLAHYLGADADDTDHRISVLGRMVREQAFTVLNRLAALLMMEARGQLIESVSKGYQSRGYQLYSKIAGTALGETGQAYQVYLFSVFDELAHELPALFDRYAATGLLFPREAALRVILDELNHFEIKPLWSEDETIGWIYQHFNLKEERKAMRKASKAPRNSRELAVRNQFFTPRYVVEYLIDNTLGNLWFKATGGKTELRNRCEYLLVKPDEQPSSSTKVRDPRTLKLLDPACGSMHFGLYAFDLFLEIYREAWAWENQYGLGSLDVSTQPNASLKPLGQTYPDQQAFLRDVPRLIIEYNIYGVDIDPRAAQIASLALWLRAQRAWHDSGVKAKDRPMVDRGNVLSAIAPPAERELRQQFVDSLDKRDGELFEKTLQLLKGLPELGVLLQVERELPNLVRQVYIGKGTGLFAQQEQETWGLAETRLRTALIEFGSSANSTYQGRLFSSDALEGMRLIDLCREKFDVVVMNPPFGDPSRGAKQYIDENYPSSKGNLLANFIERAATLLANGGKLGAIVSRTCFFLKSFADFRNGVLRNELQVDTFADLGHGVLDAMVETAAFVCTKSPTKNDESIFFRHLVSNQKSIDLKASIDALRANNIDAQTFKIILSQFSLFSDSPYIYWIDESVAAKLASLVSIEPAACEIKVGLQTGDDFRFLRLWYELDGKKIISPEGGDAYSKIQSESIKQSNIEKKWAWYSKTESAAPLISSIHLCVNWERNGAEIKAFHTQNGDSPSRYVRSEEKYFLPGISYMLRSIRLVPYVVPAGVIPTAGRSQVYPNEGEGDWVLMLLSSNLATCISRFRGENFSGPKFQNSMVGSIPYVSASNDLLNNGKSQLMSLRTIMAKNILSDDSEILFTVPSIDMSDAEVTSYSRASLLGDDIEQLIASHFSLSGAEFSQLTRDLFEALGDGAAPLENDDEVDEAKDEEAPPTYVDSVLAWKSYGVGVAFGRFDIRLATGEREAPAAQDPFEPLPIQSPGMLPNEATPFHAHVGILVDDNGHPHDLARLVEEVLARVDVAVPDDVRRWLQRDFFAFHLQRYSKSRRKAPIYWPLSTNSGSYTLWVYYPSLNNQTLFTAVNDFLDGPNGKLTQVSRECTELRIKGSGRSRDEEKQYEMLQTFEQELTDLRETLLKIAPTYQPNHDDGVQINAAPLWLLFQHKPWQKVLKDTWTKLEKGEYDWAHLAMAYWPDRVREKCKTDKSLAIAHGLEELFLGSKMATKKIRGKMKAGDDV